MCLSIMVGEDNFWLDDACGLGCLLWSHGEWQVGRQECHVDVFEVFHFLYVLSITSDVDR